MTRRFTQFTYCHACYASRAPCPTLLRLCWPMYESSFQEIPPYSRSSGRPLHSSNFPVIVKLRPLCSFLPVWRSEAAAVVGQSFQFCCRLNRTPKCILSYTILKRWRSWRASFDSPFKPMRIESKVLNRTHSSIVHTIDDIVMVYK